MLSAGVSSRVARRLIRELADHCDDLEADARAQGLPAGPARESARAALGADETILGAVLSHRELLSWRCRWPRAASFLYTLEAYVVLPLLPFEYCAKHGGSIARWGVSASLGTLLTGAFFFVLQLSLS